MNQPLSSQRVRVARLFRGLSQTELANRLGVSQQLIGHIESDRRAATDMVARALGDCLGFDRDFFFGPDLKEFREEDCYWRKRTTPVAIKSRVLAHGTLFGLLVDHLDSALRLPAANIPRIEGIVDVAGIEAAAERCRMQWGLGIDVPIRNLTRAVEHAGIVVTRFDGHAHSVDAFSRPALRSVVVLNNDKGSAARSRYDLAHECGHVVLHAGMCPSSELEAQADRFASALLMPRAGFLRDFPRPRSDTWTKPYWDALFRLKTEWGVSVAAIVRRAYDLRMINAAHYHRAYKYMSAKGWLGGGEPMPLVTEETETVKACFDKLESHFKMTHADTARWLGMTQDTLAEVSGIPVPATPVDTTRGGAVIPLMPRMARRLEAHKPPQAELDFSPTSRHDND